MPLRVLLADENLAVQKLVELTLNKEGIEVTTTDNGLSALDIAIKSPPDLILADYKMGGMDIVSFIQKTKKRNHLNGIPIILLVNSTETHDPVYLQSLGAEAFFKKPIDTQELINGIKRLTATYDSVFDLSDEVSHPDPSDLSQHFSSSEDESKTISEMLGWSTSEDEGQTEAGQAYDEQASVSGASTDDFFQEADPNEQTQLASFEAPPSKTSLPGGLEDLSASEALENDSSLLSTPSDDAFDEPVQDGPFEDQFEDRFESSEPEKSVPAASPAEDEADPFSFPFGDDDPFMQTEEDLAKQAIESPSSDEQTVLPSISPEEASSILEGDAPEAVEQSASFEPATPEPVREAPAHPVGAGRENGAALDDKIMKAVQASTEKIVRTLLPDLVRDALSKEMIADIVEEVAWEAVTPLAEAEIKKAIKHLQAEAE